MQKIAIFSAVITGILVSACAQKPVKSSATAPAATLQGLMVSVIDPNIDFVWNSIATINTAQGTEERRPRTDQDWQEVKDHALIVLDGSKQLLAENIQVAAAHANTSSHPVELSAAAIQQLINTHRAEYTQRVSDLQQALHQTLAAIEAKNVDELEKAGGIVDQACEQCHAQFWYPNDKRPS